LRYANNSKDDCAADDEFDIQQYNSIEDLQFPEMQDVSAVQNVHRLFRPTCKSKRQVGKVLVTVNAIETGRNKGVKKSRTECVSGSPDSLLCFTESVS
jgi:hypothetical protein